jgi:itaconyl-CoA hydratase
MGDDFRTRAKPWPKGRLFEDFFEGQEFNHHWGRTVVESDTILFSTITLSFNPLYYNRAYAKAHGHPDIVVNPQLIFNIVLGLSVQDCSEIGGPFLGVHDLKYERQVYPGTTLTAHSVTTETRRSESSPRNGIVTWTTQGLDENGQRVVGFRRSNLVRRRNTGDA